MDAGLIVKELHNFYLKKSKFRINNAFVFREESDFLVINNNDYTHEIEIKISKSDFKADFKKDKHKRISKIIKKDIYTIYNKYLHYSFCNLNLRDYYIKRAKDNKINYPYCSFMISKISNSSLPNKFSFCVPEGLIEIKDLPDYAGLFYIDKNNEIIEIKRAKFIHKDKFNKWEGLATKYYYRLIKAGFFND